jgi:hypothetical protein
MNAITPRAVFERVGEAYGGLAGSIAPDYSFGFRCLDVLETTLHYDRSVLIATGLERSIGSGIVRGRLSDEGADFVGAVGEEMNSATPLPRLDAWPNPMFQIYLDTRAESRSGRLPPLDRGRYLAAVAKGVDALEDAEAREEGRSALVAAGWRGLPRIRGSAARLANELSFGLHPRDLLRRALWRRRDGLRRGSGPLARLARALRMTPPDPGGAPAEVAVAYANERPVERVRIPVSRELRRARARVPTR